MSTAHHGGDAWRAVRPLVRGGTLTLAGTVSSGALQFALVVVATRGLGPDGAALFFEATALFLIVSAAVEMGARTGLVRAISRARALGAAADIAPTVSVALWPVAVAGIVAAVVVYVMAPTVTEALFRGAHPEDAASFFRVLAPFLPVAAAATLALSATRGFGTMGPFVAVQYVGVPLARVVLVGVALAGGLGTVAVAAGWAVPMAVALGAAVATLRRRLRSIERSHAGRATPTRELAARFWRYSAPRGLAMLSDSIITWIDVLLVGALASVREAGIYAAASRLVLVGTYVLDAVGIAIAPVVSEMIARGRIADVRLTYRLAAWWVMALTWPFHLLIAVFAPFVLTIFGGAFPEGAGALVVLSLAMLVNMGTGNAHEVLVMAGKTSWNLANTLVGAAINVTLNVVLIPLYGMEGAAVAWAVTILTVNALAVTEVWALLRALPFASGYAVVGLGAVACYGGVGLLARSVAGPTFPGVAISAVVATAAFGGLLWRFRAMLGAGELIGAFRSAGAVDDERRPAGTEAMAARVPPDS